MSEIETIKKHVEHLAVSIGPRGSTTEEERQAAEYCQQVYRDLGLSPIVESFRSAKSAWLPFASASGLLLLGEALYLFGGFIGLIAAILIAIVSIVSLVLELMFKNNLFRAILPKGESQNVSVKISPAGEKRHTVILMGHIDTHRTPIVYRSGRWVRFFRGLTRTTFIAAIMLFILYLVDIIIDHFILPPISAVLSLPLLILFLIAISADRTQYTPGANDNASGAAMVMGLAKRAMASRLDAVELWAVTSGCEEVGAYGAQAWIDKHLDEIGDAIFITIDNIGGKSTDPCYLTKETLIFPFESDPGLLKLAGKIADAHPELGARSHEMKAAYTEGAIANRMGLRCITFVNYTPEGMIPDWHQPSDTFERVDWGVVQRTEEFVWMLLTAIDKQT